MSEVELLRWEEVEVEVVRSWEKEQEKEEWVAGSMGMVVLVGRWDQREVVTLEVVTWELAEKEVVSVVRWEEREEPEVVTGAREEEEVGTEVGRMMAEAEVIRESASFLS